MYWSLFRKHVAKSLKKHVALPSRQRPRPRVRLGFESLEDRLVPSITSP